MFICHDDECLPKTSFKNELTHVLHLWEFNTLHCRDKLFMIIDSSRFHSLREQTPFSALHVSSFNNGVCGVPQSSLLWPSPFPLVHH